MSKYVLSTILTVTLLVGWGCEQNKANAATTKAPPAPAVTSQPAAAPTEIQPAPLEVKKEPTGIEQQASPEPNTVKPIVIEPNTKAAPPAEPNTPKSAPAQTDPVKSQPAPSAANTAATRLCDKCTEFLSKYVSSNGIVDYKMLSHKKLELAKLLDQLRTTDRNEYNSWSDDEKLAFWINAYNIELTKIILDNYPIESNRMMRLFWPPNSIRHINGIWDEHKFIIMEEEFTLREIEQRFFKKEFSEPRLFLAISYASVSGSPLRNAAYCGENLSAHLDSQVKRFIASSLAYRIDRENNVVVLSSIFNPTWFGGQFIAKYGTDLKFKQQEPAVRAVLNFLTKYISPQDTSYLETGNYTIDYIRYDWTLNENAGQ
jgi:hypothetical protein